MSTMTAPTLFRTEVAPAVRVWTLGDSDRGRWDAFVKSCPEATFFHLSGWKSIIENVFGHPTFYLYAESADGIDPVARTRLWRGTFMPG